LMRLSDYGPGFTGFCGKLERFPIVASRLWVTWILKTCRMGESP